MCFAIVLIKKGSSAISIAIARTPSHRSVNDCCPALPPRLWQPRNPEGGKATVIEGSLTFPHSSVTAGCSFTSYPGQKLRHKNCSCNEQRNTVLKKHALFVETSSRKWRPHQQLFPTPFSLTKRTRLRLGHASKLFAPHTYAMAWGFVKTWLMKMTVLCSQICLAYCLKIE